MSDLVLLMSNGVSEAFRATEAQKGNSGAQMRLTSRVGSLLSGSLVTRAVGIHVNLQPDYVSYNKSRCH